MSVAVTSTDVLIVGAGPVGLALAVELAGRGHRVLVVEKSGRIGRQPRAKTTNVRSMEHFRRWGLADRIRALSPLGPDHANRVVFATGLFGKQITAFENAFSANRGRHPDYSEAAQWIPQYVIETVLRDHAASLPGCAIAMDTELTGFAEHESGVTAELTTAASGRAQSVRARYLVGADGARSTVRQLLGIPMEGAGRIGNFLSLVLRVPGLSRSHHLDDALMYWLVNRDQPCVTGPMDRDDVWFWGTQIPPDAPVTPEANAERVRRAFGTDTVFEILITDIWAAMQLQAARYGTRSVFLAGDACHLHPPFGGYGMNLGIADAVDLGWKLSAILEGWGGDGLIASYEAERRPVHTRVIEESVENMGMLAQHFFHPDIEADDAAGAKAREIAAEAVQDSKDREFHSLGLVIGYDYGGSPIVVPDGTGLPPRDVRTYTPSAHPGRRAPHAWLADGSSLFDRFGAGFTLLRLATGSDEMLESLRAAAHEAGMPLIVLDLAHEDLSALYGASLALIRPDQHVAWRGTTRGDADAIIAAARGA
jgi:2-polyprenyl-6-methoxyphenol hydroxylase-like FAD-dependent oxidoreductase